MALTSERPTGMLHHGIRALLLLGLAVLTTLLFPPDPRLRSEHYSVGMITNADIVAQMPFEVPVPQDELERKQLLARLAVPPTLDLRPAAADTTVARLERFFTGIAAARDASGAPAVRRYLESFSIAPTPEQVQLLVEPQTISTLEETALQAAREFLPAGVIDGAELEGYSSTNTLAVRTPDGEDRMVEQSGVLTANDFLERAADALPASLPSDAQELLRLILLRQTRYSLTLNTQVTESDRDRMAQAVPRSRFTVAEGDVVVRANQPITPEVLERLTAYEEALDQRGRTGETAAGARISPLLGTGFLNLLILGVFWTFMYFFRGEVYDRVRWVTLVAFLVAVYLAGAAVVLRSGWPVEALPVVFAALTVAVLWDGRMALVLATTLAVLTASQFGLQGLAVLIPTFVGGAAAGMSVRVVRRRAQTWVFIALIFFSYAASVVALNLIFGGGLPQLGVSLAAAGGNAVVSAILAMGFIPVFESFTGITTDQTLLEWADPNRPLLRRLSMEAPGTYAHTINVANLAESAATAIGANGLLCRVGTYYHDVGKMLKPQYFVENQPDSRNPHDRLKPDTSATIVREHVTEGLRLAREEKVPDVIADFIPEHHGTQRISFFWTRAVEEYGEEKLNPDDYRYPGPRPRSRETAIAMLADSVESATRALSEPNAERIRDLINSVVDSKIAAGQLDDAPLTFRELTAIKEQFVKVLTSVYHQRIDYPETKHLTDAPQTDGEGAGEVGPEAEEPVRTGTRSRGSDHPQLPLEGDEWEDA